MDFLADDDSAPDTPARQNRAPWRVLIVDDATEVHDASRLAVSGLTFHDSPVEIISACGRAEAQALLEQDPEIHVALIDVVMESEQAGLQLVDWIRGDLGNMLTRIVLRTGQPGQAPESDVIVRYEIDDYKEKTELDRKRLITTLITAFRNYMQLDAVDRSRRGLRTLIESMGELFHQKAVDKFAEGLLTQLGALLNVPPSGLVCAIDAGEMAVASGDTGEEFRILAAGGDLRSYSEAALHDLPASGARQLVNKCLAQRDNVFDEAGTCLYLESPAGRSGAIYIDVPGNSIRDSETAYLLRLFAINASVGYGRASLFEHMHHLAYEDAVSGAASYASFCETFDAATARSDNVLVGLLDVHRFTMVEQGLGVDRAQTFLQEIAGRLRTQLPEAVTIARRQQDEFLILFEGDRPPDHAAIADRIKAMFQTTVQVDGFKLPVRPRVAFAAYPHQGRTANDLTRYASIALGELRRREKGEVAFFDPAMVEQVYERLDLASKVMDAARGAQFELRYQPIVSGTTGNTVSAEALFRFYDADGSILNTGKVIEAAEVTGLIVDLGVARQAA